MSRLEWIWASATALAAIALLAVWLVEHQGVRRGIRGIGRFAVRVLRFVGQGLTAYGAVAGMVITVRHTDERDPDPPLRP
jgi:hypothetical protein